MITTPQSPRFQFSLRMVFAVMTAVALALAVSQSIVAGIEGDERVTLLAIWLAGSACLVAWYITLAGKYLPVALTICTVLLYIVYTYIWMKGSYRSVVKMVAFHVACGLVMVLLFGP